MVTQRCPLIIQQEKLLRLAVSDYIDRIVDGRGLRQRVITQPRPLTDLGYSPCHTAVDLAAKSHKVDGLGQERLGSAFQGFSPGIRVAVVKRLARMSRPRIV